MATKNKKKQKLRNNEYYNIQDIFDDLYHKSKTKNNYKFYKLMDLITDERNIELAYRNIKKNTGSKTSGTNKHTIDDIARITNGDLVEYVKRRLQNYNPHTVRRVEIPKPNGKTRPLGIPTIEDRIIQQCIKQILEPICEAKFYNHSYGFRPNRSTHHALAKCHTLINSNKLHYVVDIDIKGFFDNVNHGKLLKQMWTLGIQDKRLLCIISKMLKAPIEGIGIHNKGTPQGGILSPLLSNIVLNELDWWIANQWEYFKTEHNYEYVRKGKVEKSNKYASLRRKSKLKEIYIVRYADDFKIFCRDYKTACKIYNATRAWLKERLNLEISEEKSKIVNLNKNYSEYLGIKMKIKDKGNKKVITSHISDKSKNTIQENLRNQIIKIQKQTTQQNINQYNAMILGIHNYYKVATEVFNDFDIISYKLSKCLYNRTKDIRSKTGRKSNTFLKYYDNNNYKTTYIRDIALFPIEGVNYQTMYSFKQNTCNFTEEGREMVHKKQQSVSVSTLKYLMENPIQNRSIEYNDNRISLYVGQNGKCPITKRYLQIGNMECHHKTPTSKGGGDEYNNLIFIETKVHKLIHSVKEEKIRRYLNELKLDKISLRKVNKLRVLVGNYEI